MAMLIRGDSMKMDNLVKEMARIGDIIIQSLRETATLITKLKNIKKIEAGYKHTVALDGISRLESTF
jgi:hypothetical protein